MHVYRGETTITQDGVLAIKGLPFPAGEQVEVIVRPRKRKQRRGLRYPLHGKPVLYVAPFQSVAEGDWEALK